MFSKIKLFDVVVVALLLTFEGLLFYNYFKREIAWYPPSNFDQSNYLATAYDIERKIHDTGPFELIRAVGSRFHFTGVALPIEGAVSGLILGHPRLAQLLVLFLSYCALQIVCFLTACSVWNSRAYGYMILGLILCQNTPWRWAGGLFDFRPDFITYCLYGIWICAVLQSRLFLDRRWSFWCGIIGGFLVLHRFLTMTYLLGVSVGYALFCILVLLARADKDLRKRILSRAYNAMISLAVTGVIVAPFLLRSWSQWYEYYVVGHGTKELSQGYARLLGLSTLIDHLLFYPKIILRDHWGAAFILGSLLALVAWLLAAIVAKRRPKQSGLISDRDETFLLQFIFLLGAIAVPLVLLTADVAKNTSVASVVNAPAALLLVCLVARTAPPLAQSGFLRMRKFVFACSFAIVVIGVANVFARSNGHLWEYFQRKDLKRLVELHKWLVDYARKRGWQDPTVSIDVLSPWLQASTITDTGFERTGQLVIFRQMLGDGVLGVDRLDALALLAKSDFAIFTDSQKLGMTVTGLSVNFSSDSIHEFPNEGSLRYPFEQKLASYRGDLLTWAEQNMTLVKIEQFENFKVTIYARSGVAPSDH